LPNTATSPSVSALHLVRRQPDQTIVEQLRGLLKEAESGEVVGLLASAHYGGARYGYFGGGSMCSTPSIGLVAIYNLATKLLTAN
jgi:hypothetical protein